MLIIIPALGYFVDVYGNIGYAWGDLSYLSYQVLFVLRYPGV